MPYRNKPLSKSHGPFARSPRLGPGPAGRELTERREWKCRRKPGRHRGENIQLCKYVGIDQARRGKVKVIREKKSAKKRYNARYNRWLKASGEPRFPNLPRSRRTP